MTICACLYCGRVTGSYASIEPSERPTVCDKCAWREDRSEWREVEAGLRPWMRPLSFWACRAGAMSEAEALIAQELWDSAQRAIRRRNLLRWYAEGSPEHAEMVLFIERNGL